MLMVYQLKDTPLPKDNQQISRSVDNESPLKTETREYFNPERIRQDRKQSRV